MNKRAKRNSILILALAALVIAGLNPLPSSTKNSDTVQAPVSQPEQALPEAAPGVPSDWWATAQADILQAEYNITWQEQTYLPDVPAAYQSPNRAHNLRSYYTNDGVIVIPRTWEEGIDLPPWRMEMALSAWGREGQLTAVLPATLAAGEGGENRNRIEFRRGKLVEWYRNDESGLEQGFTVSSPPQGEGYLQLDLVIRGDLAPQLSARGNELEFHDEANQALLLYSGLAAVDSNNRSLPVWLSLDGAILSLFIDDLGAAYPIKVDPTLTGLSTVADWSYSALEEDTHFGAVVATAGDVNADGYSDVIIGIPDYDNGEDQEGQAVLFYGSASGLEESISWHKEGEQEVPFTAGRLPLPATWMAMGTPR